MADREANVANSFETTLSTTMGSTDLTANVGTTSGGPASPCYLVIDPDDDAKREIIYFDGTFTATSFVTSSTSNRYLDGSAAGSGITHNSGAKVVCVPVAQLWTDVGDRIDADATAAVQKATLTTKGDLYVATSASTPARLAAGSDFQQARARAAATAGVEWADLATGTQVTTAETTTSTTYTDLATSGPAVTVTTGTKALIILTAQLFNNTVDAYALMGFAVSGASTIAADDARAFGIRSATANQALLGSRVIYYASLAAGSNTFTAKYRASAGTADFRDRQIVVIPL